MLEGLPAVLVNGEPVAYGVPELEKIKSALLKNLMQGHQGGKHERKV